MKPQEIREKQSDIKQRLAAHDAARKLIEAELLALRHVCQHENVDQWSDSGWGRMPSDYWLCKDCGLSKSN